MTESLPLTSAYPTAAPAYATPPNALQRVLRESAYALSSFPVALPAFVLTVTLFSTGLGLVFLVGGVLLLTLCVYVARGFARMERYRSLALLGREIPTPRYLCPQSGDSFWRRMLMPLRDPQSWLDVVWTLVGFVTALVSFTLVLTWWAGAAGGLTYWFWQRFIPYDDDDTGLAELIGLGDGRLTESLLQLAIGFAMLVTLPWVVRGAAVLHAGLATVVLGSRGELQEQVARVEVGREAARRAEASSMRRLERDIHDGPQQRLVRLTMDLGRAQKQLADDPQRASETLDDALAQARETVAELRALSRGIAPPLLVDRGLAVALREMLDQSVVPVTSQVEVPDDLPPHVETAVYFVVAEAITNIAKHSGAKTAHVFVVDTGDGIGIRVEDDGVGGAHPAKGSGLAGLQQRVAAADGILEVTSPEGGPTVVSAYVPVVR
jgi:signal transduction histidine kinase